MLRFLSIRRLAVIDAAEVEFGAGLNVLTGETGAGKSILVEAVGLLLGGRASADLVRTGEDSASVEAIFDAGGEELLIRREITAGGRSRATINDDLATAASLKDLSARLIEIHGQHEHHILLDPTTHANILDTFGGLEQLVLTVGSHFLSMRVSAEALDEARKLAGDREARLDLASFQLAEIARASPYTGEDDELKAQRQVLASAERIERLCAESYAALYESDVAVLVQLGTVWRRVGDLASIDPKFLPYVEARDGIKGQLEDLAEFLRRYGETIDASPAKLQQVEERLSLLEGLKRKYGPTLAEVVARKERLQREIEELSRSEERLAGLQTELARARAGYIEAARALSEARRRIAVDFSRQLEALLRELAMPDTRFEVRFNDEPLPESGWTSQGLDQIEFHVSPNLGEEPRPLARIASGGELSRMMLAIKRLTATRRHGFTPATDRPPSQAAPGLIFDEVDAGIGGRAADVVGRTLRALGSSFQVLCITHLPQIAAYADAHYVIEKQIEGGRTRTRVTRLDEGGRVEEIARMLGGEAVTDGLRASAREMLTGRQHTASATEPRQPGGQATRRRAKGESERAKAEPSKASPRPRRR